MLMCLLAVGLHTRLHLVLLKPRLLALLLLLLQPCQMLPSLQLYLTISTGKAGSSLRPSKQVLRPFTRSTLQAGL
jgi:hypothetical protein